MNKHIERMKRLRSIGQGHIDGLEAEHKEQKRLEWEAWDAMAFAAGRGVYPVAQRINKLQARGLLED